MRLHHPTRARARRSLLARTRALTLRALGARASAWTCAALCALLAGSARADVTRTPDGWTEITPSADTRIVYVSSSLGDDANDGLAESRPKRTIAAAKALMRHGRPDWLLLRRGDVWNEAVGWWRTSGRSADEPQLVGAWGDELRRPLLLTGNDNGIHTFDGVPSPATIDHVAIVGLAFFPDGYRGMSQRPAGVRWHQPATGLLVEDCRFDGYHTNVLLEAVGGRHADLVVRRSVLVDAFTINDSHPQGLYAYAVDGLVLEENVFDHNGWREDVPGAVPTLFRHNVYVQTGNTDVEVIGNVFANSASHGIQMRSGGVARDNLFVRCSLALLVRGAAEPVPQRAEVVRNVILDGKDIGPGLERGFGISLRGVAGVAAENVVANNVHGSFPIAIEVVGEGLEISDMALVDNVVSDWGPVLFISDGGALQHVDFVRNRIANTLADEPLVHHLDLATFGAFAAGGNEFWSSVAPPERWMRAGSGFVTLEEWKTLAHDTSSLGGPIPFPDATGATLAGYQAARGATPTTEAFLARARDQSRRTWSPAHTAHAVNDWVRRALDVR